MVEKPIQNVHIQHLSQQSFRKESSGGIRIAAEQITYKNIDPKVRNTIMIGLCVAMLGACFDGTIVGTIGTKLAEDLGGLSLYAWMTTAYLLCETIMIPIAGKLSDIYGRKPLFLIGLGLFAIGSVLAGLSTNMEMFIACRAVQGIGGGILIPVATAAVADLYSPRERARMQGILGAIFGVGSGIGPLIGGYIEGAISWHWCFYINIPLALIAFILTIKKFPTPVNDGEKHIDVKGIAFLSLLLLDILLLIEFGGKEFEWVSVESIAMVVIAIVLAVVFVKIEHKAIDPILAPHLIHNKTVVMAAVFMAIFGIGMIGSMMFTNMLAVGVFGLTTLQAGIWSLAMVVGMMITSISSGALVERTGYKLWLIAGPILCFLGLYYLSGMTVTPEMVGQMGQDPAYLQDTFMGRYLTGTFILGLGLGCMMSVVMSAVQNSSKPTEMGMTTSSVNLIRSIGTTMGTAIFTMIINGRISGELMNFVPNDLPQWVFDAIPHDTGVIGALAVPGMEIYAPQILTAFSNSVDFSFLAGGCIILLLVIIGIIFKAQKPEEDPEFEAVKHKIESGEE